MKKYIKLMIISLSVFLLNLNAYTLKRGAQINNVNFQNKSFKKVNLSYSKLNNVNFSNSEFNYVSFMDANLKNVNFSNSTFNNVEFNSANLIKVNFKNAKFSRNVKFDRSYLKGSIFDNASFANKSFDGLNLRNTSFKYTDLSNASFKKAKMDGADMSGADLRNANMSGADLRNANMSGADLRNANFGTSGYKDGKLKGANFSNANLTNVKFNKRDLSGANFQGANLTNAKFSMQKMKNTIFNNATWKNGKKCDSNSIGKCNQITTYNNKTDISLWQDEKINKTLRLNTKEAKKYCRDQLLYLPTISDLKGLYGVKKQLKYLKRKGYIANDGSILNFKNGGIYSSDGFKYHFRCIANKDKQKTLKIETNNGAKIKILNIKRRYKANMYLDKGKYHIQVSKPGYISYTKWITLNKNKTLKVKLQENLIEGEIIWDASKETKLPLYETNKFLVTDGELIQSNTWDTANKFCNNLSVDLNGIKINNFRLPTLKELKLIVNNNKSKYEKILKTNRQYNIWSSATFKKKYVYIYWNNEPGKWIIYDANKNSENLMLCIRNNYFNNDNLLKIMYKVYDESYKKAIKLNLIKKPLKIANIKPNKLQKGEYEKGIIFNKRVEEEKIRILSENTLIDKKNKAIIEQWEFKNKQLKIQHNQKLEKLEKEKDIYYIKALEKAVMIKYNIPVLKDIKYDADLEVFNAVIVSTRGNFKQKVKIPVKIEYAKEFKKKLNNLIPKIKFKFVNNKLKFDKILGIKNPSMFRADKSTISSIEAYKLTNDLDDLKDANKYAKTNDEKLLVEHWLMKYMGESKVISLKNIDNDFKIKSSQSNIAMLGIDSIKSYAKINPTYKIEFNKLPFKLLADNYAITIDFKVKAKYKYKPVSTIMWTGKDIIDHTINITKTINLSRNNGYKFNDNIEVTNLTTNKGTSILGMGASIKLLNMELEAQIVSIKAK